MVGSLFLAKIYFTDEKGFKIRPILIIGENQFSDYLVLPLTTNFSIDGPKITSNDLHKGNLKRKSIVVVDKLLTVHENLLHRKLGEIESETLEKIKVSFCEKMGCN
ncbi:MAG: type II toxin-antitoxin system PemK/MazF family toxin [Candidatus Magasanikbacteria bacterium]